MIRFIRKIVLTAMPIVILLVAVNYYGDVARLFETDYDERIAEIIVEGKNVTNISDYDERILQKELISRLNYAPDIVIVGSSRTMLIGSDNFPSRKMFNNSVSRASLEDLIAIYQIYEEFDIFPKKIIFGIDPWVFNSNNKSDRWMSIRSFYDKFYGNSFTDRSSKKYSELFSLSYFQASIQNIPSKLKGEHDPISTNSKLNDQNTKLVDGSYKYRKEYRNASPDKIKEKMKKYVSGDIYGFKEFVEIAQGKINELLTLVKRVKSNGIEVEFFLCPFSPLVYNTLEKKYPIIIEVENMLNELALSNSLKVYGSYSPFRLNYDDSYFYDGVHCKEKGIEKILSN